MRKEKDFTWLKSINNLTDNELKILVLYWGKLLNSIAGQYFVLKYVTHGKKVDHFVMDIREWLKFNDRFAKLVYQEYLARSYNYKKSHATLDELKTHQDLIETGWVFYIRERLKFSLLMYILYFNEPKSARLQEFQEVESQSWITIPFLYRWEHLKSFFSELPARTLGYFISALFLEKFTKGFSLDQNFINYYIVERNTPWRRLKKWIKKQAAAFYYKYLYLGGRSRDLIYVWKILCIGGIYSVFKVFIYKICRILYFFNLLHEESILFVWFRKNIDTRQIKKPLPKYRFSLYLVLLRLVQILFPTLQCCWAFIWSSFLFHNLIFYQFCGALYLYLAIEVNPLMFYLACQVQLWLIFSHASELFSKKYGLVAWRNKPEKMYYIIDEMDDKFLKGWLDIGGLSFGLFALYFWMNDIKKSKTFFVRWAKEETFLERAAQLKYNNAQVDLQKRFGAFLKRYTIGLLSTSNISQNSIYGKRFMRKHSKHRQEDEKFQNLYYGDTQGKKFKSRTGFTLTRKDRMFISKMYHIHRKDPHMWKKWGIYWDELLNAELIIPEHALVKRDYSKEKALLTPAEIKKLDHYIRYGDVEGNLEKPMRSNPLYAQIHYNSWENMKWSNGMADDNSDLPPYYDVYEEKDYYDPADDYLTLHPVDELKRSQLEGSPSYKASGKGIFERIYGKGYSDKVNVLYHPVLNPDVKTLWYYNAYSSYEEFLLSSKIDETIFNIMNNF